MIQYFRYGITALVTIQQKRLDNFTISLQRYTKHSAQTAYKRLLRLKIQ